MWTTRFVLFLSLAVQYAQGYNFESSGLSTRQSAVPDLSKCSASCLAEAMPVSGCNATDAACLCTSMPFAKATTACLTANCTVIEQLETRRYSAVTCNEPVRNQGDLTKSLIWVFFSVAGFGILARGLSRMESLSGTGYGWDDLVILISFLILIPSDAILHHMVDLGLGQDIWMVAKNPDDISMILYWFYISEFTYVALQSSTKIAILLLYLRMWPYTGASDEPRWFRTSCKVLIVILMAYAALLIVVLGLQCQPISFSWLKWDGMHAGYCIDVNVLIFATSGCNIFFDITVILLPVPRLLSLSIATRKKMAVVTTFLIGLFVTFCSIIRLRSLAVWGSAPNVTYLYNPIAIWSNLEINLGVLCACFPAITGLMQRLYTIMTGHKFTTGHRSAMERSHVDPRENVHDRHYELESKSPITTGHSSADSNNASYHPVHEQQTQAATRWSPDGTVKYYGAEAPMQQQASVVDVSRNGSIADVSRNISIAEVNRNTARTGASGHRPQSKPLPNIHVDDHDEIDDERPSPVLPTTFPKSQHDSAQQMIDAGYSAFSTLKGSR
ncbi:hypothetical protein CLAFUW4_09249 [Fulvia fulva]|nr:hypothetical protein CLAFUR4_09255 [Fulvia fulva]KAK4614411.1 hypothetical protein CLAFUR0_09247 [Fulvia fulva]WPV20763.1 hypothetical protein CLAFUW4_09249 [Fulvia fulva]WPV35661.1 hypothetical protein CLAFUW7_09250 [Fulvia fulva]